MFLKPKTDFKFWRKLLKKKLLFTGRKKKDSLGTHDENQAN